MCYIYNTCFFTCNKGENEDHVVVEQYSICYINVSITFYRYFMQSENYHRQNEKTTYCMGENICIVMVQNDEYPNVIRRAYDAVIKRTKF